MKNICSNDSRDYVCFINLPGCPVFGRIKVDDSQKLIKHPIVHKNIHETGENLMSILVALN